MRTVKSQLLAESDGQRTYAVVFDDGDEVRQGLLGFARAERISAAQLTAIGGFRSLVLGYFEIERKEYKRIPIDEQVEVVSMLGDIAVKDDEPALHAHLVVAKADGSAWGGHLLEAHVRPTLEVVVTESPAHLRRVSDPRYGIALLALERSGPGERG